MKLTEFLVEEAKGEKLAKVELVFSAGSETETVLKKLLKFFKKAKSVGETGTGLTVTYEDNGGKKDQFYLDGDGSFRLHEIKQKVFKKEEKAEPVEKKPEKEEE